MDIIPALDVEFIQWMNKKLNVVPSTIKELASKSIQNPTNLYISENDKNLYLSRAFMFFSYFVFINSWKNQLNIVFKIYCICKK